MKYGVIEQMRQDYPVPPMCRLLGVSVSGYYAWRKRTPSKRARQEARLETEVLAAHQRTRDRCLLAMRDTAVCIETLGVNQKSHLRLSFDHQDTLLSLAWLCPNARDCRVCAPNVRDNASAPRSPVRIPDNARLSVRPVGRTIIALPRKLARVSPAPPRGRRFDRCTADSSPTTADKFRRRRPYRIRAVFFQYFDYN